MLKEIDAVRQDDPNIRRRWFQDDYFDLFVWQALDSTIVGFQLCYDIRARERVLSWRAAAGFSHDRIDAGEQTPKRNMTPILVADGVFPMRDVLSRFVRRSRGIDRAVAAFVAAKLREYGGTAQP